MSKLLFLGLISIYWCSAFAEVDTSSLTNGCSFGARRLALIATADQSNTNETRIVALEGVVTNLSGVDAETLDGIDSAGFWQKSELLNADLLGGYAASNFYQTTVPVDAGSVDGFDSTDFALATNVAQQLEAASNAWTSADVALWQYLSTNSGGGVSLDALGFTPGDNSGYESIAVGDDSVASGEQSVAVGPDGTEATGENAAAFGPYALASGSDSVALGYGSEADAYEASALGIGSYASGESSVAVGDADADADESIAVGYGAYTSGERATSIGYGSSAEGIGALAFGAYSDAAGDYAVGIGRYGDAAHDHSFNWSSDSGYSTTTNKQFRIYSENGFVFEGGPVSMVSEIVFTNGWKIACTTNGLEFVAP